MKSLLSFDYPTTKPVFLNQLIDACDPRTIDDLRKFSEKRAAVASALKVSPERALDALEDYLPVMLNFTNLLIKKEDLYLKAKVLFCWRMTLEETGFRFIEADEPVFETTMSMLAYGIILSNRATAILNVSLADTLTEEMLKNAAGLFCKAAGIFEYAQNADLGYWRCPPSDPPIEVRQEIFGVLAKLMMAQAQQVTIKKAKMKGLSAAALAKLCVNAWERYESTSAAIQPLLEVNQPISNEIAIHVDVMSAICHANAAMYCAIAEYTRNDGVEMGKALAYIQLAKLILDKFQKDAAARRRRVPTTGSLVEDWNCLLGELDELEGAYKKENEAVYFARIPPTESLTLPVGASVGLNATPYSPPVGTFIEPVLKEASGLCNVM